jgi:sugar phosphate isomerase/epimerase
MTTRRTFIKQSLLGAGTIMLSPSLAMCGKPKSGLTLSLAEWSFHRALTSGDLDHLDFPALAKNMYNISVVEYVNGFFGGKKMNFKEAARNTDYLNNLLQRSTDAGVVNHLIMVDDEGPLSSVNEKERLVAVDDHKKWVDAAKILGCRTIRVNLHGEGDSEVRKSVSLDSLSRLGEYAKPLNINIVVENHGSVTSNGAWMADLMKKVSLDNVGTLPDFGNFCMSDPWGTIQNGCKDMYDPYKGLSEMLPYAKGVSAKTYDFDENGEQSLLDYKKLIGIVKSSGFKGYIGIEYEGNKQSEEEGVRMTMELLDRYL